ncbi:MAG: hypothetical protein ACHQHN_04550 [Sphingobacteriales bacterium]
MQTISANLKLRQRPRPLTRCKGSQVEQTITRTPGILADGFLRHCFLPLYEPGAYIPERDKVEAVYLKAVKNISAYYQIDLMELRQVSYPHNILLGNRDIWGKVRIKGRYRELRIEENEELKIEVTVTETLNTGSTLYYIPLLPLYKALQIDGNTCAKLLLGVCVYLYRKAGVCHYKDDESYVCYLYDIMNNWIEDDRGDMDEADYLQQRTIMDEILAVGDLMENLLVDENHLTQLQYHIQQFEAETAFEKACVMIAKDTILLWTKFPTANLYQHINECEPNDDDDYYGQGKIRVTEYISFIGETSSCVYESMMTMLNEDFNERSGLQDFEHRIVFNTTPIKQMDVLVYEERAIDIIEKMCDLIPQLS